MEKQESRIEKAIEMFESGYNCCQAVFATYADLYGMDKETALKLASPMGAGIGRMREVCGAVSAMALLYGLKDGNSDPKDSKGKEETYAAVRKMADQFEAENGSIICRDLLKLNVKREESAKPDERTKEYYMTRPCSRLVACAASILEDNLKER